MNLFLHKKSEIHSPSFNLKSACHLWLLDLTQLTDLIINNQSALSEEELLKAESLKNQKLEFIAMRVFVRKCLSLYTHIHPHELVIHKESKGKPFLANSNLPITFNLSHCKEVAVLAVGFDYSVGVDVESISRNRNQHAIAQRFFHRDEIAQLEKLNDTEYNRYFFQLWTLKEAFLKATGDGISIGLDKVIFSVTEENIAVELSETLNTKKQEWQFHQTFLTDDFCISLARHSEKPFNVHWFNGAELFERTL